jgi:hypothetical protein
MQGLKVKCPNCGRTDFETTDKYNPDVTPNGSMVKCTLQYHIDWLTASTTLASEMTCPECCAQLAPSGRLTVVEKTIMEKEEDFQKEIEAIDDVKPNVGQPVFICEICGKELKTKLALAGHMRSHNKANK